MKASELIEKLQNGVDEFGDLEVYGGKWTWKITQATLQPADDFPVAGEFENYEDEYIHLPSRFYLS